MPRTLTAQDPKSPEPSFQELWQPVENFSEDIPLLQSRGDRPLQMTFEQQLKSLILFHLEEYDSARHLLQVLKQDDFARSFIAPPEGIGRSSYGEALNTRGLEQLLFVYEKLQAQATATLPKAHPQLGDLVAIDGTLIDAVCSMTWADYSSTTKKAKIEKFFGWWKQHLNVYPLIARSPYGFMVQVLGGLITYLLLAIYCHKHFQEKVSINRVRELRINIQNEARILDNYSPDPCRQKNYAPART